MICLRRIKKSDTKNILKWRNSKHVMNVFIDRNVLTKEIHYKWLDEKVKTGKVEQFIAYDTVDNVDFGSAYFRDIDYIHKKAEFGIFIGEESYRGKGFGKIITKQAIDFAFTELGLNKVYARVLRFNKPSYYMFMKLGFHKDALLRQDVIIDGKCIDVYIVSLLKKEWKLNEK